MKNGKRAIATAAAMALLFTGGALPMRASAVEVGVDHVEHRAYLEGAGGTFLPEKTLTRAEAAVILARLMVDGAGEPIYSEGLEYPSPFSDVPEGAWYESAVGLVWSYGIIGGYDDNTFRPDQPISRAEFVKMISKFDPLKGGALTFSDLPDTHWAAAYVVSACAYGYISGYPDGTFRPEQGISRAETAKVVNRLLHREPDLEAISAGGYAEQYSDLGADHWAFAEVIEASVSHDYERADGAEHWVLAPEEPEPEPDPEPEEPSDPSRPGNGPDFVSDSFRFVFPELRITSPLKDLDLEKVDSIALHHMAHPTATFEDVEHWHVDDNGWSAIGYNFWIDFEGNVYVGRGWHVGAGVGGQNSHIISIGFQGDYDGVNKEMPEAQLQAGAALVAWIQERVPTARTVGGHGDFSATDCPGRYFPLEEIIALAEQKR